MKKRALTEEQRAEAAARYRAGATLKELAALYGCSTAPVQDALRAHGIPARRYVPGTRPGKWS